MKDQGDWISVNTVILIVYLVYWSILCVCGCRYCPVL